MLDSYKEADDNINLVSGTFAWQTLSLADINLCLHSSV